MPSEYALYFQYPCLKSLLIIFIRAIETAMLMSRKINKLPVVSDMITVAKFHSQRELSTILGCFSSFMTVESRYIDNMRRASQQITFNYPSVNNKNNSFALSPISFTISIISQIVYWQELLWLTKFYFLHNSHLLQQHFPWL
ncbi:conserved hypothetical protein [Xenorhabdus bovienii str. Intermedium]|uniref:Uncharacterized protein n=1 Tax=Xenorhabdus bovienii str. Intermedium TaxID=1379677 RepID=A0A077QDI1_XENBV|nr:conserved hypothetical protein [Xenorhabdus bovienii str. Intermedium]